MFLVLQAPLLHGKGCPPLISLMTGLLFAANPVHVEAVANSTGRAEVLCTVFFAIGFLFYASLMARKEGKHSKCLYHFNGESKLLTNGIF